MMRPLKSQTQVCVSRQKFGPFEALIRPSSLQRHRFASGFADIQKKIKMR